MRLLVLSLALLIACEDDSGPPRTCDAPDGPEACLCSADPPTPEPVMPVEACSAESVGAPAICCESGDRRSCGCEALGCYQNEVGICSCGAAVTFAGMGSDEVAMCEPASETSHCCLDGAARTCRCSALTCDDGEEEVNRCTTEGVAVCGEEERTRDSCT